MGVRMAISEAGFVHPEFLVETDWLAAHLDDPTVVLLDCTVHLIPNPKTTYDVVPGREDFERGHIPGAQFCDLQADLSDPGHKFRFMLPSAEYFAAAMGRFGAGGDTKVVLYSTANVWWASRVWWMLRVFGHDNAAVLNGGWQKWSREGRAAESGPGKPRGTKDFPVREKRDLMVGKAEVLAAIGDRAICTINALQPAQHQGTGGNAYGRPGHIAGSVNLPAAHLVDPATNAFLPAGELRQKFAAIGAMDRRVITYCGGGIAASADALILTMLGHENVALYDASLTEWAADPSLPMATAAT
jgi:thiosulfate/3-mercaptopyruvate sulfurtransferase